MQPKTQGAVFALILLSTLVGCGLATAPAVSPLPAKVTSVQSPAKPKSQVRPGTAITGTLAPTALEEAIAKHFTQFLTTSWVKVLTTAPVPGNPDKVGFTAEVTQYFNGRLAQWSLYAVTGTFDPHSGTVSITGKVLKDHGIDNDLISH